MADLAPDKPDNKSGLIDPKYPFARTACGLDLPIWLFNPDGSLRQNFQKLLKTGTVVSSKNAHLVDVCRKLPASSVPAFINAALQSAFFKNAEYGGKFQYQQQAESSQTLTDEQSNLFDTLGFFHTPPAPLKKIAGATALVWGAT
jgi:hypothetical protein